MDGAGSTVMGECSPPFLLPAVFDRLEQQAMDGGKSPCANTFRCTAGQSGDGMFLPHCSNFFPFTRGQLRRHDPQAFKCFAKLWEFIEEWEDAKEKWCFGWRTPLKPANKTTEMHYLSPAAGAVSTATKSFQKCGYFLERVIGFRRCKVHSKVQSLATLPCLLQSELANHNVISN